MPSRLAAYDPELEALVGETAPLDEGGLGAELGEMALAAELLEVRDERELETFLDRLLRRVARSMARASVIALRRQLMAALGAAMPRSQSRLLPGSLGEQLATIPGDRLGLELEGLSHEDRQFETARQLARFLNAAAQNASTVSQQNPAAAARHAVYTAARQFAPGLLGAPRHGSNRSAPGPPGVRVRSKLNHQAVRQSRQEDKMHNIDRNVLETDFEDEQFDSGEFEYEQYEGGGFSNEQEAWSGEYETFETFEMQGESVFSETEEMELAAELLEIANEEEFEQFLGRLIRRIGKGARSFIRSPFAKALGGVLKGLAKKVLPLAGTALGTFVGGPLGATIGGSLANAAGKALGLEAEMSQEDREFEGARRFIQIAGQTAQHMANAGPGQDPRALARDAALRSVRLHAPGLLRPRGGSEEAAYRSTPSYSGRGRSGQWMRRGNRIILFGA